MRLLDALGCAIAASALAEPPADRPSAGGSPAATRFGFGEQQLASALIANRDALAKLQFADVYAGRSVSCQPSLCIPAVLAAAEGGGANGGTLLAGLAVAYQVCCQLADAAGTGAQALDAEACIRYGSAAGIVRVLELGEQEAIVAITAADRSDDALQALCHGLALREQWRQPKAALPAPAVGLGRWADEFNQPGAVEVSPFALDWPGGGIDAVTRTVVRRHQAPLCAQSAIDALLALRTEHALDVGQVEHVTLEISQATRRELAGWENAAPAARAAGGEAGSLQRLLAVALLDGEVMPAVSRQAADAAALRRVSEQVTVRPSGDLGGAAPYQYGARARIRLTDGRVLQGARHDCGGLRDRVIAFGEAVSKFDRLTSARVDQPRRDEIKDAVRNLKHTDANALTELLQEPFALTPPVTPIVATAGPDGPAGPPALTVG